MIDSFIKNNLSIVISFVVAVFTAGGIFAEFNRLKNELTLDGVEFDSGLKSQHLVTDTEKNKAELDNPCILIVASPVTNIRKIQNVLEYVIKANKSLLIVASLEQQPLSALIMNKVKGNIKVNIVDPPGFGPTKQDTYRI